MRGQLLLLLGTPIDRPIFTFYKEARHQLVSFRHGPVRVGKGFEDWIGVWAVAVGDSLGAGALEVAKEVFGGVEVLGPVV